MHCVVVSTLNLKGKRMLLLITVISQTINYLPKSNP